MQQILDDLRSTPNTGTAPCEDASCTTDHRGHAVRLSVAGELDLATVDSLTRVAIGALRLPVRVLVLDMHGVTFCDAAGVGALLRIQRSAAEVGTRLVLAGIRPAVRRVLDLVGVHRMIPFLDSGAARPTNAATKAVPDGATAGPVEPADRQPGQAA
jgi:anti-anti-sigma factor